MKLERQRWDTPEWLAEATTWIEQQLEAQGIQRRGGIEQPHIRPWATVLHIPTTKGSMYFKAAIPALQHELPVLRMLQDERPNGSPQIIAMELSRGWVLMADAGVKLREVLQASRDPGHWHRLLPAYAALQRDLAGRGSELIQNGVPDRRLVALPAQYDQLLADTTKLGLDQSQGMTSEEHRRLVAYSTQFATLCEELAAYGLPETIDHGDLHDGNIFLSGDQYTIIDWGDSSITHPFFSLRVVLVSMENTFELEEDSPHLLETVLASYLEPWTGYGSATTLRAAYDLARRIAKINSALNWDRALSVRDEPYPKESPLPVPLLLKEFLAG